MAKVYVYNKRTDHLESVPVEHPKKGVAWIRIVDPSPQKLKYLSKHSNLPLEELEESLEEEERPRVTSAEYTEIIYRAPYVIDEELETLPIYFYIFKDKLVTIEKKPLDAFDKIDISMSKGKSKFMFKKGFAFFVSQVIDKINDAFLENIDKIAARIDIYENFSRKEMSIADIEKVYDQSVTLSFFNQALIANIEVLNTLKKGYFKFIQKKDQMLFEELYYNVLQILDTEKIQREAVTNLINVHAIITSARLNDFMKRLTLIALFIAIPTMVSGIYGMNFKVIPLANHPYGFYIVTAITLGLTYAIYIISKKFDYL